jgi:hypothetical protein
MQPILFTALAILGIALLLAQRRRESVALLIWFAALFLLYAAFYAGSVLFGVDWRFMLSLIPVASLLGGYGAACILLPAGKAKTRRARSILKCGCAAIIVAALLFSTLSMASYLSISPSAIGQAQDARFYENFVYNDSHMIPPSCLVFSFDPTLFNINNRTSTQFDNITGLYNATVYGDYTNRYGCLVIDYGFWCYTSQMQGICESAKANFLSETIANSSFDSSESYGFYRITALNVTNSTIAGNSTT